MIDIAATGIAAGMTLDDFDSLDLAYAPPFSTAIHPLVQAVYVLLNKLSGAMVSMTPAEYAAGKAQGRPGHRRFPRACCSRCNLRRA